jgi:hypothetical protein
MSKSPVSVEGQSFWETATDPNDIVNKNTGYVGIGTATPEWNLEVSGKFQVSDDSSIGGANVRIKDTSTRGFGSLQFRDNTDANMGQLAMLGDQLGMILRNSRIGGELRFDTEALERMRIDSTGNVGIGTDAPTRRLGVSSDQQVAATLNTVSVSGGPYLTFTNGIVTDDAVSRVGLKDDALTFWNEGLERMRIASDGSVGIGTDAPDNVLTVGGNISIRNSDALGNVLVGGRIALGPTLGQTFGRVTFQSSTDGGASVSGGVRLHVEATEDWGVGSTGSKFKVFTVANGTTVLLERMSIDQDGTVKGLFNNNTTHNSNGAFVTLTQAEYDGLTPDANTIYFVTD